MTGRTAAWITLVGGWAVLAGCTQVTGAPWSTKSRSMAAAREYARPKAEAPAPQEEAADLRQRAIALLQAASRAEQGLLRANAIEAMHEAPEHLEPLVRRGLVDPNHGVRFVAAMTVGSRRMTHLAHLLHPLLDDESGSVQAAAIFGLDACGESVDLTPLAGLIRSEDPEVRANAAVVLGELGNGTALPLLRDVLGRGMARVVAGRVKMVELQVAEAMVKLGDDHAMEGIRAALFTPAEQGELTALACMLCGRLADERAVPNLARLAQKTGRFQQPAEVRMAATWAMAKIDPAQAPIEVPLAYLASDRYQLRAQAAHTLAQIGDPTSLPRLAGLMDDQNPMVRVAAAGAILAMTRPSFS